MKKFLERMAQIAYSINLVNGFDTELKFLPALKIAELAKASPCIRLGAGAFLCYVAPKIPAAEITSPRTLFFYIEHTKRVD